MAAVFLLPRNWRTHRWWMILLLLALGLWGAYHGLIHLRHRLQLRFAEMHALLNEEEEPVPFAGQALSPQELQRRDSVTQPLATAPGMLEWRWFSQTRFGEGRIPQPRYAPKILAENHHPVTMRGYIFPLEVSGEQHHFLLSAYPPSCPYCLPAASSELVEVLLEEPAPFTYEPVTIHGQFSLMENKEAWSEGRFYRIDHATLHP